jgi:hypothetical protein
LLYIIFTILSMTVQPWFIAFNLLLIVNLIETMNYVLKSVTRYKGQLFMTYVFGLINVYFVSVLNYTDYAFKFQVTPEDPSGNGPIQINQIIGGNDPNEQFCSALLPCYLNVINNAIRSGNGIVALQTTESIFLYECRYSKYKICGCMVQCYILLLLHQYLHAQRNLRYHYLNICDVAIGTNIKTD